MTDEERAAFHQRINYKATYYNQCVARRRRILRAIRRAERERFNCEYHNDAIGVASAERWLQTYEMRLIEVNSELRDLREDREFFHVHPRAVGFWLAPRMLLVGGLVVLGTIVGGVVAFAVGR